MPRYVRPDGKVDFDTDAPVVKKELDVPGIIEFLDKEGWVISGEPLKSPGDIKCSKCNGIGRHFIDGTTYFMIKHCEVCEGAGFHG